MHIFWEKMLYKRMESIIKAITFPYAHVKGSALSVMAYGSPDVRDYVDFDLMVPKRHVKDVEEIAEMNGFHPAILSRDSKLFYVLFTHQDVPYLDSTENFCLDINFDVLWGEYEGAQIEMDDFLSETVEISIYGLRIKTLSPMKTLIQLCLHTFRDMNSIVLLAGRKRVNSNAFRDIYHLICLQRDRINESELISFCVKHHVTAYVFYALYFTALIYPDPFLTELCNAMKTREGERLLAMFGLTESERRPWKVDFQSRIESPDLSQLVCNDLTDMDWKKIEINRRMGIGLPK